MKQYAVYIRVSTQKQGRSGLGLESQKKICEDFIHSENGNKIAEFMDVESGTHRDRKGLREAITFCQANKCGLVIAKLDRLCRDVEFCFRVVNTGIEIHFCDMPTINTLLLGVFASVAQYERELTSDRTKKALAVKKSQGCRLGRSNPKYIETWNNKSKEEKIMVERKRGETKRARFQSSKKTVAFLKILTNVFPDATKNEDPHDWDWRSINSKGEAKDKILNMMKTMRDLDDSGHLFHKFDFDADDRMKQCRLCAMIHSMKRTFYKS
jgi:DNA invertase Pin-like site-specific DNA recombinase